MWSMFLCVRTLPVYDIVSFVFAKSQTMISHAISFYRSDYFTRKYEQDKEKREPAKEKESQEMMAPASPMAIVPPGKKKPNKAG